jgi:DNA-binding HxlR family transcriptional regulator
MRKLSLADKSCPLSTSLEFVGEWWTLLILHDVFDGYSRFDEFERNIGLSTSMLTARLKTLVDGGLLERQQYQQHPPRYQYVLTDLGRSLRPVIVALAAWGNSRLAPHDRTMILIDAASGKEVDPVVVDRATGRELTEPEFVFSYGPAASPAMRARYGGDVDGN